MRQRNLRGLIHEGADAMKPVVTRRQETLTVTEVSEEWTEESIRELFGSDPDSLVIQLLNRVVELEEELESMKEPRP